jgi:hypothetical protein
MFSLVNFRQSPPKNRITAPFALYTVDLVALQRL